MQPQIWTALWTQFSHTTGADVQRCAPKFSSPTSPIVSPPLADMSAGGSTALAKSGIVFSRWARNRPQRASSRHRVPIGRPDGFCASSRLPSEVQQLLAESFLATLERELLSRRRFRSQGEAMMAVFEWIESWCNPHRRHSALGYRSPSTTNGRIYDADESRLARIGGPNPAILRSTAARHCRRVCAIDSADRRRSLKGPAS
jgi:hypothetical protein